MTVLLLSPFGLLLSGSCLAGQLIAANTAGGKCIYFCLRSAYATRKAFFGKKISFSLQMSPKENMHRLPCPSLVELCCRNLFFSALALLFFLSGVWFQLLVWNSWQSLGLFSVVSSDLASSAQNMDPRFGNNFPVLIFSLQICNDGKISLQPNTSSMV